MFLAARHFIDDRRSHGSPLLPRRPGPLGPGHAIATSRRSSRRSSGRLRRCARVTRPQAPSGRGCRRPRAGSISHRARSSDFSPGWLRRSRHAPSGSARGLSVRCWRAGQPRNDCSCLRGDRAGGAFGDRLGRGGLATTRRRCPPCGSTGRHDRDGPAARSSVRDRAPILVREVGHDHVRPRLKRATTLRAPASSPRRRAESPRRAPR